MHMIHRLFKNVVLLRILLVMILGTGACGTTAFAQESEHDKITYMLNVIGSSRLTFIRNGNEYDGKEAKEHLQEKIDLLGNRIHTAEDFILYIGSKSLVTGAPYSVRLVDGTEIKADIWLRDQLAGMK